MIRVCRILLIPAIIFLLLLSAIAPSGSFELESIQNDFGKDSHIIENVSYVSQLSGHCFFACMEMIYDYYGIDNLDQTEINVLQGMSYNLVYQPSKQSLTKIPIVKPPYKYSFLSTMASNQGNDDIKFLANLLGLEVQNLNTGDLGKSNRDSWNDYWKIVKEEINNETPIITCVDFFVWPPFMEVSSIPAIAGLVERGGHSILIVGYNESNSTICVHDPYPGEEKQPEKGTYRWVPLKIFKRALRRSYWDIENSDYDMYIIKKVSEPAHSNDEIFRLCHERNIEKLKGNISAYDSDFISPNFKTFGIEAWRELKNDYEKYFLAFLPFYRVLNKINGMPIDYSIVAYDFEVDCLIETSNYLSLKAELLENQSLKDMCTFESELFYNESIKMEELTNLTKNLKEAVNKKILIKAIYESEPIIEEICNIIDEIISIKEQIIAGPQGGI